MTMDIHYNKHHGAYTNNLNNAIAGTQVEALPIEEILREVSKLSPAVRNNGGGYFNHNLFWEIMSPNGGGTPEGELLKNIEKHFGSFNEFRDKFSNAAATRFGSGWAWLVWTGKDLQVFSTPTGQSVNGCIRIKAYLFSGLTFGACVFLKIRTVGLILQNFWNVIDENG
jgi:Fe-Mn family superoxide dismutase